MRTIACRWYDIAKDGVDPREAGDFAPMTARLLFWSKARGCMVAGSPSTWEDVPLGDNSPARNDVWYDDSGDIHQNVTHYMILPMEPYLLAEQPDPPEIKATVGECTKALLALVREEHGPGVEQIALGVIATYHQLLDDFDWTFIPKETYPNELTDRPQGWGELEWAAMPPHGRAMYLRAVEDAKIVREKQQAASDRAANLENERDVALHELEGCIARITALEEELKMRVGDDPG